MFSNNILVVAFLEFLYFSWTLEKNYIIIKIYNVKNR